MSLLDLVAQMQQPDPDATPLVNDFFDAVDQVKEQINDMAAAEDKPVPPEKPWTIAAFQLPADALRFITAGNSHFTVRSVRTGERYTYRVRRADCSRCGKTDCHCWAHPLYFVSVMTGPDNDRSYSYIGTVKNNEFNRGSKSKLDNSDVRVIGFSWLWRFLNPGPGRQATRFTACEVWHEGRCGRCGHRLTVPESIASGLGPECSGRL